MFSVSKSRMTEKSVVAANLPFSTSGRTRYSEAGIGEFHCEGKTDVAQTDDPYSGSPITNLPFELG
jgi:hypothetical protein